ncbi:15233_t:CDS:2 [Cetraspora pellucida]|uniref:15233_t:CDS:1 n=1 Tax=Cetraspora pellucida TaxID=1433469 RepID=A0A9N8VTD6_9GLOM|nr:15233_t:CDS:2 [Cetraspora pellucida]
MKALSQDSCQLSPTKPNKLIGYYPAYRLNLTPGANLTISPSIDYLNFIAFDQNDLVNNSRNGGNPSSIFSRQSSKYYDLLNYRTKNNLQFKMILSVLLPTDENNLISFFNINPNSSTYNPSSNPNSRFVNDLISIVNTNGFDGMDIDYPYKLPCGPSGFDPVFSAFLTSIAARLGDKSLTITAGQYPINMTDTIYSYIDFVNIQAFHLNINDTTTSAGINKISQILSPWNSFVNYSKLVLGVEFGGIVEVVSDDSNSIKSNIENQKLRPVNDPNFNFPFSNEQIPDLCKFSSYAYLSWENLNSLLSPSSCPTNLTSSSSAWTYGFVSNAKQPYLYQRQNSSDLSSRSYVAFYEDYLSLNAKLDYIKNNNLFGIAIADITKDSKDLQLTNFILGIPPSPSGKSGKSGTTSTSSPSPASTSLPNTGTIVGGVIGSIIFVSALVALGIILYRRRYEAKMSNPLIDTNNQPCLDTNPQVYSDINRQVRPDTNNRIFSDTNHKVF